MTKSLLSNRVTSMTESATIRMAQVARDLKDQGIDVISLSLGEPDFDTPEHIKDAAKKALDDGYTKYSPVPGFPEVRKAICKKLKNTNKLDYTPEQIVISNGAKQSIANVVLSVVNKGDEVILFAPYWVSYFAIAKMAGGVPVELKAGIEKDYKVTATQLDEALNEKSKLIIFSSPCNPSGSVYTREELSDIADVLEKYPNVCIISDEIYEYINFTGDHCSLAGFSKIKERVATVNGFSKGYAMTGWRLGYLAAPLWLAKACSKIQGQFTSGACSFSQMASIAALDGDMEPTEKMRQAFDRRRKIVGELVSEIPGFKANDPKGAFYIFPDVSNLFGKSAGDFKINNSDDLCEYLLQEAHVAIVTGSAFGSPECVRISYASSEDELRTAIGRIKVAVEQLS